MGGFDGISNSGIVLAQSPGPSPSPVERRADQLVSEAVRSLGNIRYVDTEDLARAVHGERSPELVNAVNARLSPVEQGGFARAFDRAEGQAGELGQVLGANGDLYRNYNDMRSANTIGADKYFHCKANFEAAQRGPAGAARADFVSDAREWFDQNVKGDPASASAADQAANDHGRALGLAYPTMMGREACAVFRPNGLDARY